MGNESPMNIEKKISIFSCPGEHWYRATVLNHGDELGEAAEGDSHCRHPGLILTFLSSSSNHPFPFLKLK